MERQGVIEKSQSPWSSPVVLVKKKDGSIRFCVDYRRLNNITKKDSYPLPRIEDTLDALDGSCWFSTIDLQSGYWQISMDPVNKEKTAFCVGTGLWQFKVMPFGLRNAPATFKRLMDNVLRGSFEEEVQRLQKVLARLRKACLLMSPKKCNFFCKEVKYLGHVVSEMGVQTDPEKLDAWRRKQEEDEEIGFILSRKKEGSRPDWQEISDRNTRIKYLVSIWDSLEVYEDLLFRKWESPDGKSNKWLLMVPREMGRNFVSADFKRLMVLLGIKKTCTTPLHPQSDGLVERLIRTLLQYLSINGSMGEGSCILWKITSSHWGVRTCSREGTPFPDWSTKRDAPDPILLKVVSCGDWRCIWGRVLVIDQSRELPGSLQVRSSQNFYKKETLKPQNEELRGRTEVLAVEVTCQLSDGTIVQGYRTEAGRINGSIVVGQDKRLKRFDVLKINDEEKLIVPLKPGETNIQYYVTNEELYSILYETHTRIGHGGRILSNEPKKGIVVKPMVSSELNSRCQVDLIDLQSNRSGEYKFIMVYQDHLTKFVQLRPLKTKKAEEVAHHVLSIFLTFGAPAVLQSDNGKEFSNQVISEICAVWKDVKIVHGKPRHSQTQGSVERASQDIQNMLTAWMNDNDTNKWSRTLHTTKEYAEVLMKPCLALKQKEA
ncbi:uncharacterized protein LOC143260987 [Megalopta genalis]|uniref:uncharacterized protein LOC143260987 n=1 Tax=Megalopta genalis TaxID=115081 RepID=UPI003FD3AA90